MTLIGVFIAMALSLQQLPAPATQAPTTASIDGIVVRLGTNEPIGGAEVELSRVAGTPAAPMPQGVADAFTDILEGRGGPPIGGTAPPPELAPEIQYARTGTDGKFEFKNLKEGKYRLVAIRPGGVFFPAEYGQNDPQQRGLQFPLTAGQGKKGLRLEMTQTAAIAGRVTDSNGLPLGHVPVMALLPQYGQRAHTLNVMNVSYTNERGEYRLFWLPPGRYYVAAKIADTQSRTLYTDVVPPGQRGPTNIIDAPFITRRMLQTGEAIEEVSALVYAGGGVSPDQAQLIDVREGTTYPGIDVPMTAGRVRSYHIRGGVIGPSGQPARGVPVSAVPLQAGPVGTVLRATTDANGVFDLGGAVPGGYSLFVSVTETAPTTTSTTRTNTMGWGYQPVTVSGADVEGVKIIAGLPIAISGRVTVEGRPLVESDPEMTRIRVAFNRDPDPPGTPDSGFSTLLAANGILSVNRRPGEFRVSVSGIPPRTYLKSLRMGSVDLLAERLRVADSMPTPMEILLGADGGQVRGSVSDAGSGRVANAVVVVMPDAPDLRRLPHLFQTVSTDEAGTFTFPAVAPGAYKVFAWGYAPPNSWLDAEFMRPYESFGKTISVGAGSRQDVELSVTPRR